MNVLRLLLVVACLSLSCILLLVSPVLFVVTITVCSFGYVCVMDREVIEELILRAVPLFVIFMLLRWVLDRDDDEDGG